MSSRDDTTGGRHPQMANNLSDEELMLHVRNGVGEMLGVLFHRYQEPLLSFYCRLTGDRALSEDLVQDVFYRILKYRHTYRPGSPFRAWVYQMARNARRDSLGKQRAEVELDEQMFEAPRGPDPAEQAQQNQRLRQALLRLPEEKREVLLLSRFQELKYSEIGALLGCQTGTVKVRVFRALQELRQILTEMDRGPRLERMRS